MTKSHTILFNVTRHSMSVSPDPIVYIISECYDISMEVCRAALPDQRGTTTNMTKDIETVSDFIVEFSSCHTNASLIMCTLVFPPCQHQHSYYPCRSTCLDFLDKCNPDNSSSISIDMGMDHWQWQQICDILPESRFEEICFPMLPRIGKEETVCNLKK